MSPILVSQRVDSNIDGEFLCRNRTESLVGNVLSFDTDATTVALSRTIGRCNCKSFHKFYFSNVVQMISFVGATIHREGLDIKGPLTGF